MKNVLNDNSNLPSFNLPTDRLKGYGNYVFIHKETNKVKSFKGSDVLSVMQKNNITQEEFVVRGKCGVN